MSELTAERISEIVLQLAQQQKSQQDQLEQQQQQIAAQSEQLGDLLVLHENLANRLMQLSDALLPILKPPNAADSGPEPDEQLQAMIAKLDGIARLVNAVGTLLKQHDERSAH